MHASYCACSRDHRYSVSVRCTAVPVFMDTHPNTIVPTLGTDCTVTFARLSAIIESRFINVYSLRSLEQRATFNGDVDCATA